MKKINTAIIALAGLLMAIPAFAATVNCNPSDPIDNNLASILAAESASQALEDQTNTSGIKSGIEGLGDSNVNPYLTQLQSCMAIPGFFGAIPSAAQLAAAAEAAAMQQACQEIRKQTSQYTNHFNASLSYTPMYGIPGASLGVGGSGGGGSITANGNTYTINSTQGGTPPTNSNINTAGCQSTWAHVSGMLWGDPTCASTH